jgi:hypothetical protein
MPGASLSDHRELLARAGIALQGIAVHGRGREGRLVAAGMDRCSQPAAGGLAQRHIFHGQGRGQRKAMDKGFGDRYHGAA